MQRGYAPYAALRARAGSTAAAPQQALIDTFIFRFCLIIQYRFHAASFPPIRLFT